jgi:hypothetical protein
MKRPQAGEFADFYAGYIDLVTESNGIQALRDSKREAKELWKSWPINRQDFSYASGKWTPKDLVQHLIDAERVFAYRAMRFGREDATDLPGFDHNAFVDSARASERSWQDLIDEFEATRESTIHLFESLGDREELSGTANGSRMSLRGLCYVVSGHLRHHLNIMKERYL